MRTEGISDTNYAQKRRQLVEHVNQLRACGASTEVDLPRIAVAGKQSSGKSSIVETISGLRLPRSAGTCTRTPTEVRMRYVVDAPWSCRVSLRFEWDSDGITPLKNVLEKSFGPTLTDPAEVEAVLRRAQLAVLNPSVSDVNVFLKMSDAAVVSAQEGQKPAVSKQQLTFSPNIVVVDVSGASICDLSFLDLPGLIAVSDVAEDIKLVDNLVKTSISGNNCLILLTVTMRDDFQNQRAVQIDREVDPSGKRTVGVLTMADLVQDGEHDSWVDMLEGRKNALTNGYFASRLPAPDALKKGVSFTEARASEKAFFQSTPPWNGLDSRIKGRLGTDALTNYLSEKLGRFIADKLPRIQGDLSSSLKSVNGSLHALPPPPSTDPVTELQQRLSVLSHELDFLIEGGTNHQLLISRKRKDDQAFKNAILKTRPQFYANTVAIKVESSDKDVPFPPVKMNLLQVQKHIEDYKGRELPNNIPYSAKTSIMLESVKHWPRIAAQALDGIRTPVTDAVNAALEVAFGRGTNEELRSVVGITASETLESLFSDATSRIDELLLLEGVPYSQNEHYYESQVDKALSALKEKRKTCINSSPEQVNRALAALAEIGYPGLAKEDLGRLLADEYQVEIEACAHTLAYWMVAYKRLIDDVPRIHDFAVIRKLSRALPHALLNSLVIGGDEAKITRMMQEGPELAAERADLGTRKTRLEDAKKILAAFGQGLERGS